MGSECPSDVSTDICIEVNGDSTSLSVFSERPQTLGAGVRLFPLFL